MVLQSNHFCEPSIETIIFGLAVWTRRWVEVQFTKINSLGKKLDEFLEKKNPDFIFEIFTLRCLLGFHAVVILMF